MSQLQLKAMLVIPFQIKTNEFEMLIHKGAWRHWSEGLSAQETTDQRRFYNRACADIFRPLAGGRYVLNLNHTSTGNLSITVNETLFECQNIIAVQLEDHVFLYLPITSESSVDMATLFQANRDIFALHPKTTDASLPSWSNQSAEVSPLLEHLYKLLALPPSKHQRYNDDWFGHESPGFIFCNGDFKSEQQVELASRIAAGEIPNRLGYQASEKERQVLASNSLNPWSNWTCLQQHRKVVFIGHDCMAIHANIFDTGFYTDLFALALLHRIKLQSFQELLTAANHKQIEPLQKQVQTYRKTYRQVLASTYPLGQRLAGYFEDNLQISLLEERVFKEIHQLNEEVRRQQGERDNFLLFVISLLAAIALPLNTLSTVLSVDANDRSLSFWLTAGISTSAIIFIILVVRLIHKRTKGR